MIILSPQDLDQLAEHDLDQKSIEAQLALLRSGTKCVELLRAATTTDGIEKLNDGRVLELERSYEAKAPELDVVKFVPASGAATRMFQHLSAYLNGGERTAAVGRFFQHKEQLAFWRPEYSEMDEMDLLRHILQPSGLGMSDLPKGAVPFHRYTDEIRTAFHEQMIEGVAHGAGKNGIRIHFTVPPRHRRQTEELIERTVAKVSEDITVTTSVQRPRTDTICLHADGRLVREEDGLLVLRPGGHGSLLIELNESVADIIFIKNIDNVAVESKNAKAMSFKKVLAGRLLEAKDRAKVLRERILKGEVGNEEFAEHMKVLGLDLADMPMTDEEKIGLLQRPFRVCGMVRNEGEPGGGPFWTIDLHGRCSLQIVESAQMDLQSPDQATISAGATHFNPVDIVCSTTDLDGRSIDLMAHRDMGTSFVTSKVVAGREVTILEWPGLWNGSMANWNTIFVEVPLSTFNPVKTVNDLFRQAHQI